MSYILYKGDCLDQMKKIGDKSIDLILCDLPYGYTDCSWDIIIDPAKLWAEYKRILKPEGTVALFGDCGLFTAGLITQQPEAFKYNWIWKKPHTVGFLNANKQPLRNVEAISIF